MFKKAEKASGDSERLFRCIEKSFGKHGIPLLNIFACSFDNCNTMKGSKKGLMVWLRNAIMGIIFIFCPAHNTNLCVDRALQDRPNDILSLLTSINAML